MGVPVATERRVLTEAEFEAVARTRHPEVRGLPKEELIGLARRVRECRDEARDIIRQRRRGRRGEADTSMKKWIFASALSRVNREIGRLARAERRDVALANNRRALETKRAGQVRHHPSAGRTTSRGMRSMPNRGDPVQVDPREVGRVSQAVWVAQARSDS